MKVPILLVILFLVFAQAAAYTQPGTKNMILRPTSATSGEEMYLSYCADCHGRDGTGHGPKARANKTRATDLTILTRSSHGKFPAELVKETIRGDVQVVAHGAKDMPAWGLLFTYVGGGSQSEVELRIHHLTEYIRAMQK